MFRKVNKNEFKRLLIKFFLISMKAELDSHTLITPKINYMPIH